ncbi:MAG: hypothetical protein DRP82_02705, partial [Planctomycetota bacterium]
RLPADEDWALMTQSAWEALRGVRGCDVCRDWEYEYPRPRTGRCYECGRRIGRCLRARVEATRAVFA